MTGAEAADLVPYKPNRTRAEFIKEVQAVFVRALVPNYAAEYDEAGNCTTCGEAGRCPGRHALTEHPERRTA